MFFDKLIYVFMSLFLLCPMRAQASSAAAAAAHCGYLFKNYYELDLLEKLVGVRPVDTPRGPAYIKDRSIGLLPTDIELARTFIEQEVAKLGFTSRRQSFPVDVRSMYPIHDVRTGLSLENQRRLDFMNQLLSSHVDQIVRMLPKDFNYSNIIVEIPGTDPEAQDIIIGAHYDAVSLLNEISADQAGLMERVNTKEYWATQGAVDNGSGVITLFSQLKRLSQSGLRSKHNLVFVFFDGEELNSFYRQKTGKRFHRGLKGSGHFVDRLSPKQRSRIKMAINFDTVGSKPPNVGWAAALNNMEFKQAGVEVHQVIEAAPILFSVETNVNSHLARSSDAFHFVGARIPIASFASAPHFGQVPDFINSPQDTLELISWEDFGPFLDFAWELLLKVSEAHAETQLQ